MLFSVFLNAMSPATMHAHSINRIYNSDHNEDIELSRPHRMVEVGDNYVRVTYDFNETLIAQLDTGNNLPKVYGFIHEAILLSNGVHLAELSRTDLIRIPIGNYPHLSIYETDYKDYPFTSFQKSFNMLDFADTQKLDMEYLSDNSDELHSNSTQTNIVSE